MNTPAFVVEREAHLAIYTYIRSASRFPLYPMTIRLPDKGDYAHCYFAMPAQRIIPHTQKERFTITFRPIHRERAESVRIVRKCSQSTTIHHHANSNAIPSQPNNLNSYITPIHTHTPTPSHPNGAHNRTKAHLIRLIPHSAVHGTLYIYMFRWRPPKKPNDGCDARWCPFASTGVAYIYTLYRSIYVQCIRRSCRSNLNNRFEHGCP